jgi:hypothetical protein
MLCTASKLQVTSQAKRFFACVGSSKKSESAISQPKESHHVCSEHHHEVDASPLKKELILIPHI